MPRPIEFTDHELLTLQDIVLNERSLYDVPKPSKVDREMSNVLFDIQQKLYDAED